LVRHDLPLVKPCWLSQVTSLLSMCLSWDWLAYSSPGPPFSLFKNGDEVTASRLCFRQTQDRKFFVSKLWLWVNLSQSHIHRMKTAEEITWKSFHFQADRWKFWKFLKLRLNHSTKVTVLMLKGGDPIPPPPLIVIPCISVAYLKSSLVPTAPQATNNKLHIYPRHLPRD